MTSDKNGVYRGVYTYGQERISVRDLVEVEGVPNNPLYYLYDGRGSVTQLTNSVGNVRDKYRYTPFGVPMSGGKLSPNTKLLNNPYGYNGEYHDLESGLQYLRARYYNPETARFITRDSYLGDINEPLSLNRYAYTENNPVMNIDPSGHKPVDADDNYGSGGGTSVTKPTAQTQEKPVLKIYSTDKKLVKTLQTMLQTIGYDIGKSGVDGYFETDTFEAVKAFQKNAGLQVNGKVGGSTWKKLEEAYNNVLETGMTGGIVKVVNNKDNGKGSAGTGDGYVKNKLDQINSYNDKGCGEPKEGDSTTIRALNGKVFEAKWENWGGKLVAMPIDLVGYGNASKTEIKDHTTLDIIGASSGVNYADGADIVNAIWYLIEGDLDNSYISAMAILKDGAIGGRYLDDVSDAGNKITKGTGKPNNIDLSKLKSEDVTREIAKWLIGNPINASVTKHPYLTQSLTGVDVLGLFYAGGFVMDGDGVYHARQEWSIQSFEYSGYNDFYDTVFHYATSMAKDPFKFSYNDKDYVLWAWKGDYLNLGAGAEMGIYTNMEVLGAETKHWLVDQSLAMPMTLKLDYNGKQIISYDPKKVDPEVFDPLRKSTDKWWVTGFNPYYQDVKAGELTATYTVNFSKNKDMFKAFYSTWNGVEDVYGNTWKFDTENNTASLTFKGGEVSK